MVGIHKKMSHHLARRTFATTVLLYNDVPMEIVSALLGHSTMSVTQDSYAKIVNKKIATSMIYSNNQKGCIATRFCENYKTV